MNLPFFSPSPFPKGVKAGFFTRQGGVSSGMFSSLNVTFDKGDPPDNVRENRHRICQTMETLPKNLITLKQTHSTKVFFIDEASSPDSKTESREGDAIITNVPGLLLGIQTADCVPILLTDTASQWIGAIHAGWKGAYEGIIDEVLKSLKQQGVNPATLVAALGPCIWQDSYEVSQEFYERFPPSFFKTGKTDQHWYFDLPGYVTWRLQKAGVSQILPSVGDTFKGEDLFFSYRRHTLRQESGFGNLLSTIMRCS